MARRVASSTINWASLLERVPEAQKPQFLAFKAKSDSYLRRVTANPEVPPKLDWNVYKNKIAVTGLVDCFQKSYDGVKIPYPAENLTPEIDKQEKEVLQDIKNLSGQVADEVCNLKAEIARISALVPYSSMTLEEFYQAHPEQAIDTFKKPTYWPHEPECQLDYEPKDPQPESSH